VRAAALAAPEALRRTGKRVRAVGREAGIGPNYAHATYLVNLAAGDSTVREKSIDNLSACAGWADRVGLAGIVVHVGSGRGQSVLEAETQVASALEEVLSRGVRGQILLENSAGSGEYLGSRFSQIGSLLDRLGGDARLGLCLDTAHTFASGYDLRVDAGIQRGVDEIDQFIGIARLKLIHANDSKVGLNSFVDRHANIGKGQLGEDAFRRLLAHPACARGLGAGGARLRRQGPRQAQPDDLKRLAAANR
jgi:deoxyribonuclease-4